MKLLSFKLPDFNGLVRGSGSVERAVDGEVTVELGGDGRIDVRKPPGSCVCEEDSIMSGSSRSIAQHDEEAGNGKINVWQRQGRW